MPLPLPVPATYLPSSPTRKVINLLDLCRRLIAQWQYSDLKFFMNLSNYESPASKQTLDKLAYEIEKDLQRLGQSLTPQERNALKSFLKEKVTVSKIGMSYSSLNLSHGLDQGKKPTITMKQFKNQSSVKISEKELRKIYWRARMRYSCATVNQVVGRIVPNLKKLGYQGFLLPNGDMVTFESMNYVILEFVPKNIFFVDCNFSLAAASYSEVIESPMSFEKNVGPFVQHVALCFNLPATPESPSKTLVVDQTGTQFELYGASGEMVHWNYIEDYLKAFPALKIKISGYERYDYEDGGFYPNGPHMIEQTLRNINLPSCDYCGEVEGREIRKELTILLKKCANCKNVRYCDVICQKLGWRRHKIVCKSG